MKTLNEVWVRSSTQFKDLPVVQNRVSKTIKKGDRIDEEVTFKPVTYKAFEVLIKNFAHGLISLGLKEEEAVGLIAENSMRWLVADFAVLGNRCFDVPRGCSSTLDEIKFILTHSEARFVIVEDQEQLDRLMEIRKKLSKVSTIIVLSEDFKEGDAKQGIYSYNEVLNLGKEYYKKLPAGKKDILKKRREKTSSKDLATIMYTSGTTGKPKGIPLTHGNIMHIVETVPFMMNVHSDDVFLSILPIWHAFERTLEYCTFRVGASICYTTRLTIVKDMQVVDPTYMASVPRIWIAIYNNVMANIKHAKKEKLFNKLYKHSLKVLHARRQAENREYLLGDEKEKEAKVTVKDYFYHYVANTMIYSKVRAKLGKNFTAAVSGGGALPRYVDDFFEIIGVPILEGYGLTETSPILTARTFTHRIPYTCGSTIPQTEIKVCDEEGNPVPDGVKGVVWVNGPQVMSGYYKNKAETKRVMKKDKNGTVWFDTGDLGVISAYGDLSILGRIKDTIVLIGGENVEPEPIEAALLSSDYIEQVMLVGQDQEFLAALIVPNESELRKLCREHKVTFKKDDIPSLVEHNAIKNFYRKLLRQIVSIKTGFKDVELVSRMTFVKPFTPEDETLSLTQKVKRHKVFERDEDAIRSIYPKYNETRKDR